MCFPGESADGRHERWQREPRGGPGAAAPHGCRLGRQCSGADAQHAVVEVSATPVSSNLPPDIPAKMRRLVPVNSCTYIFFLFPICSY